MKKCPYCAEEIQNEAIKCRYCGEWVDMKPADDNLGVQKAHQEETKTEPSLGLSPQQSNVAAIVEEKKPMEKGKRYAWTALLWIAGAGVVKILFAFGKSDPGGAVAMALMTIIGLIIIICPVAFMWGYFSNK